MKNTIKARKKILCNTCSQVLLRVKSIKVEAGTIEEAIEESKIKFIEWKKSLKGQNCRVCDSIIKKVGAEQCKS